MDSMKTALHPYPEDFGKLLSDAIRVNTTLKNLTSKFCFRFVFLKDKTKLKRLSFFFFNSLCREEWQKRITTLCWCFEAESIIGVSFFQFRTIIFFVKKNKKTNKKKKKAFLLIQKFHVEWNIFSILWMNLPFWRKLILKILLKTQIY